MNTELRAAVLALLMSSWKTIGYNYDNLAETDKEHMTRAQFMKLVTLGFEAEANKDKAPRVPREKKVSAVTNSN